MQTHRSSHTNHPHNNTRSNSSSNYYFNSSSNNSNFSMPNSNKDSNRCTTNSNSSKAGKLHQITTMDIKQVEEVTPPLNTTRKPQPSIVNISSLQMAMEDLLMVNNI